MYHLADDAAAEGDHKDNDLDDGDPLAEAGKVLLHLDDDKGAARQICSAMIARYRWSHPS